MAFYRPLWVKAQPEQQHAELCISSPWNFLGPELTQSVLA